MKFAGFFGPLIIAFFSIAQAEKADSLKGIVVDEMSKPVNGAAVALGLVSTTTDSTGYFMLNGIVPVRFFSNKRHPEELSFQGNDLKVQINTPQELRITFFDLRGRTIKEINFGLLNAGTHRFNLSLSQKNGLTQSVYIVLIRCGNTISTLRWISGLGLHNTSCFLNGGPAGFEKSKSAVLPPDTLIISKTGYATRRIYIKNYSGKMPPITLFSEANLRQVFISAPSLPGAQRASVLVWTKEYPDTLSYILPSILSGRFTGTAYALKHKSSKIQIVYADSSGKFRGNIKADIDSTQDTLLPDFRQVSINGSFAPGSMGYISARLWKDSIPDTFLFFLDWNNAEKEKYKGVVLVPAHSEKRVLLSIRDSVTNSRLGVKVSMIDSTQDSITINCTSSLPIVSIGPDSAFGWGDTIRLRGTAVDSVDTIVKYAWGINKETKTSNNLVDVFTVVPMFTDSIYPCSLSATDSDGNTVTATLNVPMTCSVRNFRIINDEAPSWVQTDNFTVYAAGKFPNVCNSDTAHLNDIEEVSIQNLKQLGTRTLRAVVKDLGNSSAARSLFNAKKAAIDPNMLLTISSYADSVVVLDNSDNAPDNGIIAYARFKSFFMELYFDGFLDLATVKVNAQKIISVYEQRAVKTTICRNE